MISRRIVPDPPPSSGPPIAATSLRRLLGEPLLEPIDIEPLSEEEESARHLEDRPSGGARHRDDVRPVYQLVLERVPARQLVEDAFRGEARRLPLALLAPRLGTDLIDHRGQLTEGGPRLIDGLAEAEPGARTRYQRAVDSTSLSTPIIRSFHLRVDLAVE